MRFQAGTWPIGCLIAVGLGTIVLSHWTHHSHVAKPEPLVFVDATATGQPQENAGTETDRSANSADEALRADTSWSLWPPATDF
jgi:hypothetical protein